MPVPPAARPARTCISRSGTTASWSIRSATCAGPAAEAARNGHPDAPVPRLKPGSATATVWRAGRMALSCAIAFASRPRHRQSPNPMFNRVLTSIFGSRNDRVLRQLSRIVARINALEPEMQRLNDSALRGKTAEFRQRVAAGEGLDRLLPEAFAVVREASRRVLGLRHYDVQLIGGMVLHQGKIAEMRTGEGKTLVATLPVYLNALEGKGVHVVTVNDYLAKRDAAWMGKVYNFLDMTVG